MARVGWLPCLRMTATSQISKHAVRLGSQYFRLHCTGSVVKRTSGLQEKMQWSCQQYNFSKLFKPVNITSILSNRTVHTLSRSLNGQKVPQKLKVLVLRGVASGPAHQKADKTALIYICAIGIFMVGAAYAGVPLYRIFCQATGRGGQAVVGHDTSKVETMTPVKERNITVKFNADVASSMRWNFKPQQSEVKVLPGETALAFYTARNPTAKPIIGISTYNVVPFEAGQYFNKIQCFCFEEQRLNPHEQVDMPVFFYIDPEFAEDPKLDGIEQITLSYTFFEAKEGLTLPLPGYVQPTPQPQT